MSACEGHNCSRRHWYKRRAYVHLLESKWLNGLIWLEQNPSSCPEQTKLMDDDEIVFKTNPTESVFQLSIFIKCKRMKNGLVYSLRKKSK